MITPIGALRVLDPVAWGARIRKAMTEANGEVDRAAAALEVSPRTLFRWLEDPTFKRVTRAPVGAHRKERGHK